MRKRVLDDVRRIEGKGAVTINQRFHGRDAIGERL